MRGGVPNMVIKMVPGIPKRVSRIQDFKKIRIQPAPKFRILTY